jgi:hypothetical protein
LPQALSKAPLACRGNVRNCCNTHFYNAMGMHECAILDIGVVNEVAKLKTTYIDLCASRLYCNISDSNNAFMVISLPWLLR